LRRELSGDDHLLQLVDIFLDFDVREYVFPTGFDGDPPRGVQSLLNPEIGIRLSNDMALGETDFELMGMRCSGIRFPDRFRW